MGKPKTGKKQEKSPILKVLNSLRRVKTKIIKELDEKIITAIIALLFTISILGITVALGLKYFMDGNPQNIDAIKTIWAVLGTPYGLVLGYYFIK